MLHFARLLTESALRPERPWPEPSVRQWLRKFRTGMHIFTISYTCIYIYTIYTYIWLHHIHSNYNQIISYIYICSDNDSYSEVFTNYDSYQLSGVAIITVLDGLNSSDVGWRLMQLWVLPAVILVAAERLGCLWLWMVIPELVHCKTQMVMSFSQQFALYRNVEFQKFKHSSNFSAKLASFIKSSIRRAALCLPRWQQKWERFHALVN